MSPALKYSLLLIACLMLSVFIFLKDEKKPSFAFQHSIYIWQRLWTPSLAASITKIAPSVKSFRILATEFDVDGKPNDVAVNFSLLNATTLPIYAVMRIDGRSTENLTIAAQEKIISLLSQWQQSLPNLAGVEIDYDCPTAQLEKYTEFLVALKRSIPGSLSLSNTVLPTWMESAVLPELLRQTDDSILQLHAVMGPQYGLFDSRLALAWVKSYQQLTTKPFQVALPAYGSKVLFSADGKILAIQSEQLMASHFEHAMELDVQPQVIAEFMKTLAKNNIHRVVWFRLPTDEDKRAWPIVSLLAVINQLPLIEKLAVKFEPEVRPMNDNHPPTVTSHLWNLVVLNQGNIAVDFPVQINVPRNEQCIAADGINGYSLTIEHANWIFKRTVTGNAYMNNIVFNKAAKQLMPQQQQTVAWLRCADGLKEDQLHVIF